MNTDKIYAETIANEYSIKKTTKVVQLKKLDKKAKMPATLFGYIFGTISTLTFGSGMCFAMEVLSSGISSMIIGSVIGIFGIIGMSVNYFIYRKILRKNKEKYAGDIISLAKQISEEAE